MKNKKRILVIDDDPSITRLLALQLEKHGGYVVMIENDTRNVLEKARNFRPHLVLCDVDMPYWDGGEVATLLETGLRRRVPLVFLTGLVCSGESDHGKRLLGGFPFLSKPIKSQEVLDCISRVLERHTAYDLIAS